MPDPLLTNLDLSGVFGAGASNWTAPVDSGGWFNQNLPGWLGGSWSPEAGAGKNLGGALGGASKLAGGGQGEGQTQRAQAPSGSQVAQGQQPTALAQLVNEKMALANWFLQNANPNALGLLGQATR